MAFRSYSIFSSMRKRNSCCLFLRQCGEKWKRDDVVIQVHQQAFDQQWTRVKQVAPRLLKALSSENDSIASSESIRVMLIKLLKISKRKDGIRLQAPRVRASGRGEEATAPSPFLTKTCNHGTMVHYMRLLLVHFASINFLCMSKAICVLEKKKKSRMRSTAIEI